MKKNIGFIGGIICTLVGMFLSVILLAIGFIAGFGLCDMGQSRREKSHTCSGNCQHHTPKFTDMKTYSEDELGT